MESAAGMVVFHRNSPLKWRVPPTKKGTPQGSTPETNLGHPRAKNGEVASLLPERRRAILRAAEVFMPGSQADGLMCDDGRKKEGRLAGRPAVR